MIYTIETFTLDCYDFPSRNKSNKESITITTKPGQSKEQTITLRGVGPEIQFEPWSNVIKESFLSKDNYIGLDR